MRSPPPECCSVASWLREVESRVASSASECARRIYSASAFSGAAHFGSPCPRRAPLEGGGTARRRIQKNIVLVRSHSRSRTVPRRRIQRSQRVPDARNGACLMTRPRASLSEKPRRKVTGYPVTFRRGFSQNAASRAPSRKEGVGLFSRGTMNGLGAAPRNGVFLEVFCGLSVRKKPRKGPGIQSRAPGPPRKAEVGGRWTQTHGSDLFRKSKLPRTLFRAS